MEKSVRHSTGALVQQSEALCGSIWDIIIRRLAGEFDMAETNNW
jgi:hypothetical protein